MIPQLARDYARAKMQDAMTQSCVIRRTVRGVDATFGTPTIASTSDANSVCYVTEINQNAVPTIADEDKGRVFYAVHLPFDADVIDGDKLLIDGAVFEIRQVMARHTNDVRVKCFCVRSGS